MSVRKPLRTATLSAADAVGDGFRERARGAADRISGMIAVEDSVLVLLAAGASSQFGDVGSKLEEEFLGRPLGLHVAVALESVPFKRRVAVVTHDRIDYAAHGFEVVTNDAADRGMAHALCLAIACAKACDPAGALIALADMPRVTAAHVHRLFDASSGDDTVVASSDGTAPKPPALFGRGQFEVLMNFSGDMGARELVAGGRHVVTAPAELIDINTPAELDELRQLVRAPELTITRQRE